MQLIGPGERFPDSLKGGVAAIGNFDGMHRGHQTLLGTARGMAEAAGRPWGVLTFEPHPRSFFKPDEPVFRLTPAALKARLVSALGASFMAVLDFNAELSNLEAGDFVARELVARLGVSHVVTGYDFHFGRGRKGSPAAMAGFGETHGFGVTIVDQVTDEGDQHSPFSSSSIRRALRHGHVAAAAHELGYYWTVLGQVVPGDKRGRAIGFPTVNIVLEPGAEPFRGIYGVRVREAGVTGGSFWTGAGYFGNRPTFDSDRTFLEVYLIGFDGDLYGKTLLVELVDLIRPDRRFETVAELTEQMRKDCAEAEAIIARAAVDKALAAFPLGRLQEEGRI
ncbi:MAG: bifunctional riboflavin kinase/FAD synthetase [Rhizobiales bacterium]|nr:bifunctional riboflavin kinase/FAD synthetase [Hyphomicrobiales bacterium]MBI3672152.1 bifunctional riboflavin kinase/FAD synthetase [Hyphomicrobiales bacterium]